MTFTAYALRQVLREVINGNRVAGYTTKPGSGMQGLFLYARDMPRGELLGYRD